MADRIVAETLPELYRSILDAVADLEAGGHRREATRVRARASAAYGRAWDAKATATLERLRAHAQRVAARRPGVVAATAPARGGLRAMLDRASGRAPA